jgi:hypothetical protein
MLDGNLIVPEDCHQWLPGWWLGHKLFGGRRGPRTKNVLHCWMSWTLTGVWCWCTVLYWHSSLLEDHGSGLFLFVITYCCGLASQVLWIGCTCHALHTQVCALKHTPSKQCIFLILGTETCVNFNPFNTFCLPIPMPTNTHTHTRKRTVADCSSLMQSYSLLHHSLLTASKVMWGSVLICHLMELDTANFHHALLYLLHIWVKLRILIESSSYVSEGWYKQVETARVKKQQLVIRMP